MLEGVVLQQTRGGDDLHPSQGNVQQRQEEDVLVRPGQQPDGHPKRRKRGASKDTNRVYTHDALLTVENSIKDEEPRKVGTFEMLA